MLEAYVGGDLLDVGAFHGWYSLLLAHRMAPGSRAVSLEPDLHASSNLMRVLAEASYLYPAVAFAMLPVAVGDGSAMRVSFPGGGHPCFTSGDDSSASASRTATIDGLVAGLRINPGFVKIDVEGAESFVLAGMHETISCFRPKIMLEVHHKWQPEGRSPEQLSEQLMGFGYRQSSVHRSELADRQLWVPR